MNFRSNDSSGLCYTCPHRDYCFYTNLLNIPSSEFDGRAVKNTAFTAKQYLYRQGDMNHELYVLRDGWVMLARLSEDGKRQVFRSVLPGELLGFQQHLHGPAVYSAIALLDSAMCRVPNIVKICSSQPEFGLSLASAGAYDMMLTEKYLTNIAHRSARERIAFLVSELYHRLRRRDLNRGYTIQFPLKQEDIADTLGLTTIHVNRTLHALKDEGLLEIHKNELTILDYDALCSLTGSEF